MNRRHKPVSAPGHPRVPTSSFLALRLLTQIAFVLAVALVTCRVLMPETISNSPEALETALAAAPSGSDSAATILGPRLPGPAEGLILDFLFCVPALLILARRAFDRDFRLLGSWSHVPMALLGILAFASPLWAADKFAAAVSATHFLAALILIWAMSQLVRHWLRLRLVAGVCIGMLLALLMVGYSYHALELQDLRETWSKHKIEILAQHGWADGSYQSQNFEKRILNGQPMAFSTSTNTYAAMLVILATVSAGVMVQRAADGDRWGMIIVPILALVVLPLKWTGCRAAYATPVIGAIMLVVVAYLRPWLRQRWRQLYLLMLVGMAAIVAIFVRHGLRTGNLWHDSLNFRWRYWIGAYRVLTSGLTYYAPRHYFNLLFGVGWENFGPYYLAYRLPNATEEIRDPHNFLIRTIVELGIVGGIVLIIWMLRLSWELVRPLAPVPNASRDRANDRHDASFPRYGTSMAIAVVLSISIAALAFNSLISIDFDSGTAYIVEELIKRLIFLVMVVLGMVLTTICRAKGAGQPAEAGQIHLELDDRPAAWMLYAILIGLGTFLIHNLIEFSLFEPGPMFLFAMLTGAAMGVRTQGYVDASVSKDQPTKRYYRVAQAGFASATALWLAGMAFLIAPIVIAEMRAARADADTIASVEARDRRRLLRPAGEMASAFSAVRYNSDYARRAATLLITAAGDQKEIQRLLDSAVAANRSVKNLLTRAQFEREMGQYDAELYDFRCAVKLDPCDVRTRLEFARELLEAARKLHDKSKAADAAIEIDRALDNNNQLSTDEVKRLTPKELADAQRDLAEADKFK